jgi:hypothetical protein
LKPTYWMYMPEPFPCGSLDRQRPGDASPSRGSALVVLDGFVSSAFRSSRVRLRRRILCRRSRPNLALSPFLSDTVPSLLSPMLGFRRPIGPGPIPPGVRRGIETYFPECVADGRRQPRRVAPGNASQLLVRSLSSSICPISWMPAPS